MTDPPADAPRPVAAAPSAADQVTPVAAAPSAADQVTPAAGAPRRGRGRQTVGDMLRSLAVVVAVVAVVIFLRGGSDPDPVRVVDFQRPLADARELAGYPVWGPVGLDDGWRATSARVTQPGGAVVWHVGFVTPDGDYAGLDQSDGPTKEFLDRFAEDARREGSVRLGDRTWRRLGGGAPEPRALWLQEGAAATVVSGGAPWAELEQLARSLRSG